MSSDKNERLRPVDWAMLFAGTFEAELLLELMLRHFGHPLATDREYRNSLLEAVAGVLHASADGEILIEDFPPDDMNFVAAPWFVRRLRSTTSTRMLGVPGLVN
ncbi:MAG: hypothetical protein R3C59_12695 [Planctomycetaceae bacterium]